jgi:hypothetical protein
MFLFMFKMSKRFRHINIEIPSQNEDFALHLKTYQLNLLLKK